MTGPTNQKSTSNLPGIEASSETSENIRFKRKSSRQLPPKPIAKTQTPVSIGTGNGIRGRKPGSTSKNKHKL